VCADPPEVPGALAGYEAIALSRQFPFEPGPAFDVITSIGGIMCFANTAQFVGNCARRLWQGGLLLVSNDNCLSVRDRLSYLFLAECGASDCFSSSMRVIFSSCSTKSSSGSSTSTAFG
jgi:hypothetical protein